MKILAVDTGGTKVRLALATPAGKGFDLDRQATLASADFDSLTALLRHYLDQQAVKVDVAGVAVPGPVIDRSAQLTNLPWSVSADELARSLGLKSAALLNDLEGLAWSIDLLPASSLHELQAGTASGGNRALIAAGTGLGQALLADTPDGYLPFATEGGHCDFAPVDAFDLRLLHYLEERYEHVSWERVVSGPGLVNIFVFLLQDEEIPVPDWFAQTPETDQAAAISNKALQERESLCLTAFNKFIEYYAREAGNLALKTKATGGVYIGGGIAPKILSALQQPAFIASFNAKGRMRPLLESMPVRVILDDRAALYGIARYARARAAT